MPALPWLDGKWRRSAARRLRELAERLEPPLRPDAAAGDRPAGVVGTERGVGTKRPTPVRRMDISGAPEHWVQLLRDAGLVPTTPNPRSQTTPTTPNPRSHHNESRPGIVRETWPASPLGNNVLGSPPRLLPSLTLGKGLQRPPSAGSPPDRAIRTAATFSGLPLPTAAATTGEETVETPAAPVVEAISRHAQSTLPVLRLRGIPPVNSTELSATEQAVRYQEPPASAKKTSPLNASPPSAPMIQRATTPQHQSPEAAPAAVVRSERPRRELSRPERQGHPSAIPDRTPAAPTTGNWPELAPRPPRQPSEETSGAATAAMARAARLSNEHLAV